MISASRAAPACLGLLGLIGMGACSTLRTVSYRTAEALPERLPGSCSLVVQPVPNAREALFPGESDARFDRRSILRSIETAVRSDLLANVFDQSATPVTAVRVEIAMLACQDDVAEAVITVVLSRDGTSVWDDSAHGVSPSSAEMARYMALRHIGPSRTVAFSGIPPLARPEPPAGTPGGALANAMADVKGRMRAQFAMLLARFREGSAAGAGGSALSSATGHADIVTAAYREALRRYAARDFDGAWAKAYEALQSDPGRWDAWQMIGNCQDAKGDRAGALISFRRALELNPDAVRLKAYVDSLQGPAR